MPLLKAMPSTVIELWKAFVEERSISLCPTSLTGDYKQVGKWLERCPEQDINNAKKVMIWTLGQKPVLASRRVAMYIKTMYRWASQEDIGYLDKNPLASFKMPKAPQRDDEIVVIPRHETGLVLAALEAKQTYRHVNWAWYHNSRIRNPRTLIYCAASSRFFVAKHKPKTIRYDKYFIKKKQADEVNHRRNY